MDDADESLELDRLSGLGLGFGASLASWLEAARPSFLDLRFLEPAATSEDDEVSIEGRELYLTDGADVDVDVNG